MNSLEFLNQLLNFKAILFFGIGLFSGFSFVWLFFVRRLKNKKYELDNQLQYAVKMASIGTMVSGVSYELNSPAMSMIGHVHSLKKLLKGQNENVTSTLNKMEESVNRMDKVLKRLRSMGTYSSGGEKNFGINQAIINSIFFLENRFKEENIELNLSLPNDIFLIYGVVDQFEEMVQQVLLNSLKAFKRNQKRTGEVNITVRKVDGYMNKIKLSIEDNAGGISEDILGNIFNPIISKTDAENRPKMVGMGLVMVKDTVIRHRGAVYVNSRKGKTEFSFILPVSGIDKRSIEDLSNPKINLDEFNDGQAKHMPHVVVVDDQPDIGEIVEMYLEEKAKVKSYQDPMVAIEKMKNLSIDILITDYKMPNMTGVQLAGTLKSFSPKTKIILITGHEQDPTELKSKYGYIDEILFKPFDGDSLIEAVDNVLSGKKQKSTVKKAA